MEVGENVRISKGGSSEILVQELSEANVSSAVPSNVNDQSCDASRFEGSNTLRNTGLEITEAFR